MCQVYDCEKRKRVYEGSFDQCKKYINAMVGFDAFIGGENWTKYKILTSVGRSGK
jgi:hypothetical protein